MRKDIGDRIEQELLNVISSLKVDETTKSNLMELVYPQAIKSIKEVGEQISLKPYTEKMKREILSHVTPQAILIINQWIPWLVVLHWVIRHWVTNHKIPNYKIPCHKDPNRKKIDDKTINSIDLSEVTKPIGDVLRSILRILEYFNNYMDDFNKENIHLMNQFLPIAREIYDLLLVCEASSGKDDYRRLISRYALGLSKSADEISYSDNLMDPEKYPELYKLFETIIFFSRKDRTNSFNNKFLTKRSSGEPGLVTALSSVAAMMNTKKYVTGDAIQDDFIVNIGSGKARLNFNQTQLEKLFSEGWTQRGFQSLNPEKEIY